MRHTTWRWRARTPANPIAATGPPAGFARIRSNRHPGPVGSRVATDARARHISYFFPTQRPEESRLSPLCIDGVYEARSIGRPRRIDAPTDLPHHQI
jgi:hypothetical protein